MFVSGLLHKALVQLTDLLRFFVRDVLAIGVVAIGTLGTWALPDKERNLSIRNQKVLKY